MKKGVDMTKIFIVSLLLFTCVFSEQIDHGSVKVNGYNDLLKIEV